MGVLIPCGGADQRDMATLLIAVARENGIDEWKIRVVVDGFDVPQELLDAMTFPVEAEPILHVDNPVSLVREVPVKIEPVTPKRRGRPPGSSNKSKQPVNSGQEV